VETLSSKNPTVHSLVMKASIWAAPWSRVPHHVICSVQKPCGSNVVVTITIRRDVRRAFDCF